MDGMLGIVRPGGGSGRDDVSIQVGGWAEFVEHGDLYVAGAAHLVNRADLGADRRENPLHVVADLYRRFGIDAVQRLEGQYCLALWDSVEKSLLLAVDRFATRALYYAAGRNGVVFGSSLRDTSAETDRRIDPQAILEYLLYQAVPAPRTAYRGVCKLPAGHLLVADARGIRLQRYWEMTYPESSDGSAADWARALRAEIEAAVGRYAEAEGEADRVGCFLSGGTDSSTVAGMLGAVTGKPTRTFSIGYAERGWDELAYARIAARWFAAEPHEWRLDARESLDVLPRVAAHYEEPFGNSSVLPTYRCAQLAREHGVDVMFAGDGGDEIFAGNERYASDKIFDLYQRIPLFLRRTVTDPLLTLAPPTFPLMGRAHRYVRRSNLPNPRRILSYSLLLEQPPEEILCADFIAAADLEAALRTAVDHYDRPPSGTSPLNRLLYMDLQLTIADNDLRKVGGMTELAGVEVRYPLLDRRLVELSGRIPSSLKLRGFQKRYIFKRALADFLPPEILKKPKHGFGVPVALWMKTHDQWRDFVGDLLHDSRTRQRGYIQPDVLDTLWQQLDREGHSYYGDSLWPWLMLELWHREIDGGAAETAAVCASNG